MQVRHAFGLAVTRRNLWRDTPKILDDAEAAIGIAAGQITINAGVMASGIHVAHALRSGDPDPFKGLDQCRGIEPACGFGGTSESMNAEIGPFAKVGQKTVSLRPDTFDARLATQLLQILTVFRRIERHEIGIAGVEPLSYCGWQLAGQQLVIVPHDDSHSLLQPEFGKALEQRQLILPGKIRHKHVRP